MSLIYKKSTRGAAMMIFVLFFAFATSSMMFLLGQSIFSDLSDFNKIAQTKKAFLVTESLTEDVAYRMIFGTHSLDSVEVLTLNGVTAYSTTTHDSLEDTYYVNTESEFGTTIRKSKAELSLGNGTAFNYGLQAGNGGIKMGNNASIIGNVYANGSVIGHNSSNKADISGDLVSAGPTGLAQYVNPTGSLYANTIDRIDAGGDAHFNVQVGTNAQNPVAGTRYSTLSPFPPLADFPISTTTIQLWKDAITNHGTVIAATDPSCSSGTYTIDTSITIGYLLIECNLDIVDTGSPATTVTVTGPVWVQGNLSFTQGPTIQVHPSVGRRSVQFIVDNPSNRLTSSKIEIRNSTNFIGSGDSRSYIMLMSLNESAREGGSDVAIDIAQSANGTVVAYADSGLVQIGNSISLKSVTGYQIDIAQSSSVTYETGLASMFFTSGPGGGYTLDNWRQAE